jgi:hypothetical protein
MPMFEGAGRASESRRTAGRRRPGSLPASHDLRFACLLCRLIALGCSVACLTGIAVGGDAVPLLTIAVLAGIVALTASGTSARLHHRAGSHRGPCSV